MTVMRSAMLMSLLVLAIHPASAAQPEPLSPALMACSLITDEAQRLKCYDKLAFALFQREEAPAESAEATEPQIPATFAADELFGKEKSAATTMVEELFGAKIPDTLRADIAEARQNAYGKWILQLANGQIWMQLDSKTLRLREGDTVEISAASSGSFLLVKATGGRGIRVKRLN